MSSQTISLDYANDILFELEKAFWDERGKGARFRVTTVGRGYFNAKCSPLIKSNEIMEMVHTIEGPLKSDGIIGGISIERNARVLRVCVEGCVHRPVEDRMVAAGVRPFTCMIANQIVLAVEEKQDLPIELVEIKLDHGACHLQLVLFDKRPFLE
jgi:hypothetical protein